MANRFDQTLPKSYKSLCVQFRTIRAEYNECLEISDPDNVEYHNCDCEYCPVPDAAEYTDVQRLEAAEDVERLEPLIAEYKDTIAAVERYAKWRNIELPKEKL